MGAVRQGALRDAHRHDSGAHDVDNEPRGEVFWRQIAANLVKSEPFTLKPPAQLDLDGVLWDRDLYRVCGSRSDGDPLSLGLHGQPNDVLRRKDVGVRADFA